MADKKKATTSEKGKKALIANMKKKAGAPKMRKGGASKKHPERKFKESKCLQSSLTKANMVPAFQHRMLKAMRAERVGQIREQLEPWAGLIAADQVHTFH